MSRIAKEPVELPQGVEFNQSGTAVSVKGGNGTLSMEINSEVELVHEDNMITVKPRSGSRFATAISGTTVRSANVDVPMKWWSILPR